jgi:hypothetical protein
MYFSERFWIHARWHVDRRGIGGFVKKVASMDVITAKAMSSKQGHDAAYHCSHREYEARGETREVRTIDSFGCDADGMAWTVSKGTGAFTDQLFAKHDAMLGKVKSLYKQSMARTWTPPPAMVTAGTTWLGTSSREQAPPLTSAWQKIELPLDEVKSLSAGGVQREDAGILTRRRLLCRRLRISGDGAHVVDCFLLQLRRGDLAKMA